MRCVVSDFNRPERSVICNFIDPGVESAYLKSTEFEIWSRATEKTSEALDRATGDFAFELPREYC